MADKTCNDCRQRMTCIMAAPDGKWTACEQFKEKEMDLIDRQAALAIIQNMYPGIPRVPWMRKDWQKRYEPYIRTENAIRELPSAEKTGKWENIDIIHDRADAKIIDWQQAQCSVCGKWQTKPYLYGIVLDPYCPSCGARMVG